MIKRLFIFCLLIATVITFTFFKTVYQVKQARFNVDALDRFLRSYEQVTGKIIESISELPDFHLVSKSEGLELKSDDLKKGIYEGYVYDLHHAGTVDYVLSASPVGFMAPRMEFAVLRDGNLYANKKNIDETADSRDEVKGWEVLRRAMRVRTMKSPDYMVWE